MRKYRCTICGYVYDDAKEEVKFEDLPEDWKCPICGAPKNLFVEMKEDKKMDVEQMMYEEMDDDLHELSPLEISVICSNLARGCEKQYLEEEKEIFRELANYYEGKDRSKEGNLLKVKELVEKDLKEEKELLEKLEDRGAKRVLTWASKSTSLMNMIIDNYNKKGIDYFKNTKIWVCDICGFIYIGEEPPAVCPVCKVPNFKILEVK